MYTIKEYSDKYHYDNDLKVNLPCWISPRGVVFKPDDKKSWKYVFASNKLEELTGIKYNPHKLGVGVLLANKGWMRIDMSHSRPDYSWGLLISPKGMTKSQEKALEKLGLTINKKPRKHDTEIDGKKYYYLWTHVIINKEDHTGYARILHENFYAEIEWCIMNFWRRLVGMKEFNEIDSVEDMVKIYSSFVAFDMNDYRVEAHKRLCELLNVKYEDFKPFEDVGITELLTENEARRVLNTAILELKKQRGEANE